MAKKPEVKKPAANKKPEVKKAPAKEKKVAAKAGDKRDHFISKAPVRRLMKDEGAGLVSDDALILMIETLETQAVSTTKKALNLVQDEKRKRLTAEDISWATR